MTTSKEIFICTGLPPPAAFLKKKIVEEKRILVQQLNKKLTQT
jgi:hypothetical protein